MQTCKEESINSVLPLQLWRLKLIVEPAYATTTQPCKLQLRQGGLCVASNSTWAGQYIKSPRVTQSTATAASLLTIYPYGYAITCDN